MDLSIQKLTKAFNQKGVFKDLIFEIKSGSRLAISGSNGAGKSTLLKILSGGLLPSSGKIFYSIKSQGIPEEEVYQYVHFVAPYNTVIEELTLVELFLFHKRLGLLRGYPSFTDWKVKLEYPFQSEKQIKTFSSGMKQRVKLGLALLDERPLILLDEPGSNLDAQGKEWFFSLLNQLTEDQTLIIASNDEKEIAYCSTQLNLEKITN